MITYYRFTNLFKTQIQYLQMITSKYIGINTKKYKYVYYVHYAQIESNTLTLNRQENQFIDGGSTRVKYIN